MSDAPQRSMLRALLTLAWPLTASFLLNMVVELVAVFWISRIEGTDGLSVVTAARPLIFCLLFVFCSIQMGASVVVGRSIGAGTGEGMRTYAAAIVLVLVLWLVTLAVLLPLSGVLVDALGSGKLPRLSEYLIPWLLVALPIVIIAHVGVDVASAAKQTRVALVRTLIDLAMIAALSPLLVSAWGLPGVPVAQAISAAVLAAFLTRTLWRNREEWKLGEIAGAAKGMVRRWLEILDIGLPVQLARAAAFATQAAMIGFLADDGVPAVAGYGTCLLLITIGACASLSIAQGGAILVAQASGAGDVARVRAALRTALPTAIVCGMLTATIFFFAGRLLLSVFTDDPAVLERGVYAMGIMSFGLVAIGTWQVFLASMAALKASKRGGLVGVVAELLGLGFVLLWESEPRLESVAFAFLVSNFGRALLLGLLLPSVLRKAVTRTDPPNR